MAVCNSSEYESGDTGAGGHFNTGVDTDTELTEIPEPGIYGGIQYKTGAGGQLALDLVYSNRQAGNEIEIRNMDFSRYALLMVNEGKIAVETTVTFRNCKFDAVTTGREDARISYVFEECTLRNFQGSNATFTRCRLGGSSGEIATLRIWHIRTAGIQYTLTGYRSSDILLLRWRIFPSTTADSKYRRSPEGGAM